MEEVGDTHRTMVFWTICTAAGTCTFAVLRWSSATTLRCRGRAILEKESRTGEEKAHFAESLLSLLHHLSTSSIMLNNAIPQVCRCNSGHETTRSFYQPPPSIRAALAVLIRWTVCVHCVFSRQAKATLGSR